jgi:hypothetical protein
MEAFLADLLTEHEGKAVFRAAPLRSRARFTMSFPLYQETELYIIIDCALLAPHALSLADQGILLA